MTNATNFFLNSLKEKNKIATDYKLAQFIGIPPARIANYRSGRREFDDSTCLKIADLLGYPDHTVLLSVWSSREKNPRIRKVYDELIESLTQ